MGMLRAALLLVAVCAVILCEGATYSYTGGNQQFTVPYYARVQIIAKGASGGRSTWNYQGGRGASITTEFNLLGGTVINMMVGGVASNSGSYGGSGGGGTFVWANSDSQPLVVAGGGGGATNGLGLDANLVTNGRNDGAGQGGGSSGADGGGNYVARGWNNIRSNPSQTNYYGDSTPGWPGAGGSYYYNGGGGSGYSGGAGGYGSTGTYYAGGGGGSYVASSVLSRSDAYNAYDTSGQVVITVLYPVPCSFGWTSSGWTSSACSSDFLSTCTSNTPSLLASMPPPTLNSTTTMFVNNSLIAVLNSPVIIGRTYTSLNFDGANDACGINNSSSSMWTGIATLCNEEIKITMPWTNKLQCGFRNVTTDASNWKFQGRLLIAYNESVGNFSGASIYRQGKHQYDILVSFPRYLTVSMSSLSISSSVVTSFALTKDNYNANSQELTLEFTSGLAWSNMLLPNVTVTTPNGNIAITTAVSVNYDKCTSQSGSQCLQTITMGVSLLDNSTCTFDGVYTLNGTVSACRNASVSCAMLPVGVSFRLASGSVCAKVSLSLSISGTLNAYSSTAFTSAVQSSNFSLGSQVFFQVVPNAGTGNVVAINFVDISFQYSGNAAQYLMSDGATQLLGTQASLSTVPSQNYFSMYLSGQVFKQGMGGIIVYTFNVKVEVVYTGNKKRMVEYELSMGGSNTMQTSTMLLVDDGILSAAYKQQQQQHKQQQQQQITPAPQIIEVVKVVQDNTVPTPVNNYWVPGFFVMFAMFVFIAYKNYEKRTSSTPLVMV